MSIPLPAAASALTAVAELAQPRQARQARQRERRTAPLGAAAHLTGRLGASQASE
jgi:hypothetical protein